MVGMLSGLIISSVHFVFIYVFAALACARGFAAAAVPAVTGAATLLALVAAVLVLFAAFMWHPERPPKRSRADQVQSFMRWMTAAISGLSIVTILWNGLPILLVPACG